MAKSIAAKEVIRNKVRLTNNWFFNE